MFDKLLHKYLRLPYGLNVHEYKRLDKSKKTIVFLHGIGSSGSMWQPLLAREFNASVITIDLLGFGNSPKPTWARYDANIQARAVAFTLSKLALVRPVIIVGHSMGSLVAVELAKMYPKRVSGLILCSPPFYRQQNSSNFIPNPETLLKKLYKSIQSNPLRFAKLTTFATKYKLVNPGFNVTSENVGTYMAALEGMILNQASFDEALKLQVPTYIIRGNLDPFVITKNLKYLENLNPNISVTTIPAGHEIRGRFIPTISSKLEAMLSRSN